MKKQRFQIGAIPAILYGETAKRAFLFLHGQMGCKEEAEPFAQAICPKGYQVLSIDLPGHGMHRDKEEELTPWTAVPEIQSAIHWAQDCWDSLSLRANSIGAYLALLAFQSPDSVLLVSPILDMERLILKRLDWVGVSEAQLEQRGEIAVSPGQTLSWEYLCWVREHPVCSWTCPVHILYGSGDNMTPRQVIETYARRHDVTLTVVEGGEHWFHTPEQLAILRKWEERWV